MFYAVSAIFWPYNSGEMDLSFRVSRVYLNGGEDDMQCYIFEFVYMKCQLICYKHYHNLNESFGLDNVYIVFIILLTCNHR